MDKIEIEFLSKGKVNIKTDNGHVFHYLGGSKGKKSFAYPKRWNWRNVEIEVITGSVKLYLSGNGVPTISWVDPLVLHYGETLTLTKG